MSRSTKIDAQPNSATRATNTSVDVDAVRVETSAEHLPRSVILSGVSGAEGEAMGEQSSSHVIVWSVLPSMRQLNVPVKIPGVQGGHGPSVRVERITLLPGENPLTRQQWDELQLLPYYQRLIEEEMIGEGTMPKVHQRNTFDVVNGELRMNPASKKNIGVLCSKANEVDAAHKARMASNFEGLRLLNDDELARAGYPVRGGNA